MSEHIAMEISCQAVLREISNYLDGEIDDKLRAQMSEHFKNCNHCTAVLDGTNNVIRLIGDKRTFSLPAEFSARLRKRLESAAKD